MDKVNPQPVPEKEDLIDQCLVMLNSENKYTRQLGAIELSAHKLQNPRAAEALRRYEEATADAAADSGTENMLLSGRGSAELLIKAFSREENPSVRYEILRMLRNYGTKPLIQAVRLAVYESQHPPKSGMYSRRFTN